MYICPSCNKKIEREDVLVKHFLKCWKEKNPHQRAKLAPRSEDINIREVNDDIVDFFNSFKE
jgi:hypothetical protein